MPRPTVLLIDDKPTSREALALALISADQSVIEVSDGETANHIIEICAQTSRLIDLIILDLDVPDIHATDFLGRLRSHNLHPPLILLSGWSGLGEWEQVGQPAGQVLPKPLDLSDILASVEQFCEA